MSKISIYGQNFVSMAAWGTDRGKTTGPSFVRADVIELGCVVRRYKFVFHRASVAIQSLQGVDVTVDTRMAAEMLCVSGFARLSAACTEVRTKRSNVPGSTLIPLR